MSNPLTSAGKSRVLSCGTVAFMPHPLADKTWAGIDAEAATFAVNQVGQGGAVQLVQVRKIQQWPQVALACGVNKLLQIRQMSLE